MFRATNLGHHSWLFEGRQARLLVDPILTETWGFTPAVGLEVFPPRQLDLAKLPPIDAVMLTHEHEGHFEIPSLLRLDRRIPIYISARASIAMGAFVYAYEPQGCRFRQVDVADPMARYAVVMECNAVDLLLTLRAEVTANTLLFGRSRVWQPLRERFMTTIAGDLLRYCHPARFAALYDRVAARFDDITPCVAWSGSCSS